jgi:hypothetical protein
MMISKLDQDILTIFPECPKKFRLPTRRRSMIDNIYIHIRHPRDLFGYKDTAVIINRSMTEQEMALVFHDERSVDNMMEALHVVRKNLEDERRVR